MSQEYILRTWEDKKDVVVSLGTEDMDEEDEDKMRRGFHIQVLKESMFAKAIYMFTII